MTAEIALERYPSNSRYFGAAIALHVAIIGLAALASWIDAHRDTFGAQNPGGTAVGIEAVKSIPLPHSGPQNPLAHDTPSQAPQEQAKPIEQAKKEVAPPDAIALNMRKEKKKQADVASERQRFRPFEELEKNQIYSKRAPAVSSPIFSAPKGAGQVGAGPNTTLGNRFAGYAAQIQEIIASKWRTNDVDPSVRNGPRVIATFDLMRDGSIQNVQLLQTSGISSLDFSVKRAILDANPLPPIPREFDRDRAKVEFWFELKR